MTVSLRDKLSEACGALDWNAARHKLASLVRCGQKNPFGPINFQQFCNQNNILVCEIDESLYRGRLEWIDEESTRIFIQKGLNTHDYRFTLAHELGHWLIQSCLSSRHTALFRGPAYHPDEAEEEEVLADSLAIELLLPGSAIDGSQSIDLHPSTIAELKRKWMLDEDTVLRSVSATKKQTILKIIALPSNPSQESSYALIDKVQLYSPDTICTRFAEPAQFPHPRRFTTLCDESLEVLSVKIGNREIVGIVEQKKFRPGVVPQLQIDAVASKNLN